MTIIDTVAPAPTNITQDPTSDSPVWFYRMNPFTRSRFSQRGLVEALSQALAAEREVARAAHLAGRALHELIGHAADENTRKSLLATSRAIRRAKRLPEGPQPDQVREWEAAVTAQEEALSELQRIHGEAMTSERQELARQLADPYLRASLELVSPQVASQASRYVRDVGPGGEASSRILKSERGLIQYVTRAAVRTSPLSQLTAVGLTHPEVGGTSLDDPLVLGERSSCSVDRVMLDYVVSGVLETEGSIGDDPHVSIPPTGAVEGDKLFVLRSTAGGWNRVGVRLRPPLAQLVGALVMGPSPLSKVAQHLQAQLGIDATHAKQLVRQAASQGLVCFLSPTTDADVVDLEGRSCPTLEKALPQIAEGLNRLGQSQGESRRETLTHLEEALGDLSRDSRRPARVAVTEDRLLELAPIDPSSWEPALTDLGPAVDFLAAFDWLADVTIAMTDTFVAQHGAGSRVSLVDAAPALVEEVTRAAEDMISAYNTPGEDLTSLPSISGPDHPLARLYTLRQRIEDVVGQSFKVAIELGHEEVVIDPQDVKDLLAGMPECLRERPLGYGVLVQSVGDRLVINDGLPGHGMLYSRFLGAERQGGGGTISRLQKGLLARYSEPGYTLVEDRSHHGLNVNVHPPVLQNTLEPSDWHRLELAHDPSKNALAVFDGHTKIKVLPIGGGHPRMYPQPLSVASGLSISGRLFNSLPDTWASRDDRDKTTTRHLPRMLVGEVIISRARWYPGTDLEEALAIPEDVDRLLAVSRWREQHSVPAEVIIKTVPDDQGPEAANSAVPHGDRLKAKPQYVDLDSALCVRVLPRMLARRGTEDAPEIYLEEAAPGVINGTHAAEWVVEVNRRANSSFSYGGQS